MTKIESRDSPSVSEPAPQFATDAEVAFAQRLRRKLEEIYLGDSVGAAELLPEPSEIH